jgi:acetyl esterase/lipase
VTLNIPSTEQNLNLRIHVPFSQPQESQQSIVQGSLLPVLIWFGSGGFVFGLNGHEDYKCRMLANFTNYLTVAVDYRLAPEFPYPAAINDGIAAVTWIVNSIDKYGGDPAKIHIGGNAPLMCACVCTVYVTCILAGAIGEGSGGNIATVITALIQGNREKSLLVQAKSQNILLPNFGGLALQSLTIIHGYLDARIATAHWTAGGNSEDRSHLRNSYFVNDRVNALLTTRQLQWYWQLYLNIESSGHSDNTTSAFDVNNYLVSPVNMPFWLLQLFPGAVNIITARHDILVDENEAFGNNIVSSLTMAAESVVQSQSNIDVNKYCFEHSIHGDMFVVNKNELILKKKIQNWLSAGSSSRVANREGESTTKNKKGKKKQSTKKTKSVVHPTVEKVSAEQDEVDYTI